MPNYETIKYGLVCQGSTYIAECPSNKKLRATLLEVASKLDGTDQKRILTHTE
jgi:hypothetical protein